MKYVFSIVLLAAIINVGCAKKNVPAATPVPPTTPAPVAVNTNSTADKMVAMGHDTYTAKCGRCHALKIVDNYTASDWEPILASMAIKAKLDETEKANVLAYVQANAKK